MDLAPNVWEYIYLLKYIFVYNVIFFKMFLSFMWKIFNIFNINENVNHLSSILD
jgi:hypothetical protein